MIHINRAKLFAAALCALLSTNVWSQCGGNSARCEGIVGTGYGLESGDVVGVYASALVGTSCTPGVPIAQVWCSSAGERALVGCINGGGATIDNEHGGGPGAPWTTIFDCRDANGTVLFSAIAKKQGVCPTPRNSGDTGVNRPTAPRFGFYACAVPKTAPSKKKDKGPPNCPLGQGNPINAGNGNKFQQERDFSVPELPGLEFVRHYNTIDLDETRSQGSIAPGWTHTFDRTVTAFGEPGLTFVFAEVQRPNGQSYIFNQSGSDWIAEADVSDSLRELVDGAGARVGWRYTTSANDAEEFDALGRLLSIRLASGRTIVLTYSDGTTSPVIASHPGLLIHATDDSGRRLSFTYDASDALRTLATPDGQLIQYEYDGQANLAKATLADGSFKRYHYNEPANTSGAILPSHLTGITDENGARHSTYQYDTSGRAIVTELAGGVARHSVSYAAGNSTVIDPLLTSRTFGITSIEGVAKSTSVSQPCPACGSQQTQSIAYDARGNVASRKDFKGNLTCYSYDLARNLETSRTEGLDGNLGSCTARVTTPATRTISTQWHAVWRVPVRIAEPLRTTSFSYNGDAGVSCAPAGASTSLYCSRTVQATTDANGSGGFSATADGAPHVWTYVYNAVGKPLSIDGPRTDVSDSTTFTYFVTNDPSGRWRIDDLATMTNGLGHTTQFLEYDGAGRIRKTVDANGLETKLEYWSRGWLKSRAVGTAALGYETTSFEYDSVGQMTKVVQPDQSVIGYRFDAAHRLYEVFDGLDNRITFTLDNSGNRMVESTFDGLNSLTRKLTREIDALGRVHRVIGGTDPANQVTEYTFDDNGNVATVTDPLSRVTTNSYDPLNRLVKIIDPVNGVGEPTLYTYNGRDALATITDPAGLTTTYTRNGHDELKSLISANTGSSQTDHDLAGNPKTSTDARGVVVATQYDALNRTTTVTYPDEVVVFSYDGCTNGIGRVCSISDRAGITTFSYDLWGRVISKSQQVMALTQAIAYTFNAAGQLASTTLPSGRIVEYGYQNGRPIHVKVNGAVVLDSVQWESFGPIGGWRWGNSTSSAPNFHDRVHDLDYRLSRIVSDKPSRPSGSAIIDRLITWDGASRVSIITDVGSATPASQYTYDNLDQLTHLNRGALDWDYFVSGVGDRYSKTVDGATTTYGYFPGTNKIQSATGTTAQSFSYDAAGNTLGDGTRTWTYGGNNRQLQVTVGATTTHYLVNALGQRVRKATGTAATRFVFDTSGRLVGEYDDSGVAVSEHIWLENLPVAVVTLPPEVPTEQVIDNVSTGFTAAGSWYSSSAAGGFLGSDYFYHEPSSNALGAVIVDDEDPEFTTTGTWTSSTAVAGYLNSGYRFHDPNGPPPTAIVADNGDATNSIVGTWPNSTSVTGYWGAGYQTHASGTGASTFTWNLAIPASGAYQVFARWTAHANRATNAPYSIATASGPQVVSVNQQTQGGQWVSLGTWDFNTGTATVRLSDQANGFVVADAVMFVPAGAAPNIASWRATLPEAGNWRVYARWTNHPNRATNANYRITTTTGTQTVVVNQQSGGGAWQALGTFSFNVGDAAVSLTDQANGIVIADAIKFEPEASGPEFGSWVPNVAAPTLMDVYARWTVHANRATTAQYVVRHQSGTTTVSVNQQQGGGSWALIGRFVLEEGSDVRLLANTQGYVVADALRFVVVNPGPAVPTIHFVHSDHLGTPREITRASDNRIMWQWSNDEPFGDSMANENPTNVGHFVYNLRYPGQLLDVESGMHYNYHRNYDPRIGRYVESDPIGLRGGTNLYLYVNGRPTVFTDYFGLEIKCSYVFGGYFFKKERVLVKGEEALWERDCYAAPLPGIGPPEPMDGPPRRGMRPGPPFDINWERKCMEARKLEISPAEFKEVLVKWQSQYLECVDTCTGVKKYEITLPDTLAGTVPKY